MVSSEAQAGEQDSRNDAKGAVEAELQPGKHKERFPKDNGVVEHMRQRVDISSYLTQAKRGEPS